MMSIRPLSLAIQDQKPSSRLSTRPGSSVYRRNNEPFPSSPISEHHDPGNSLRLSHHDIKKLRSSWNSMLNDIFDESSDSADEGGVPSAPSTRNAAGAASSLFCQQLYQNLIKKEPNLEKMFPTIKHQAAAFSGVITIAMSSLENISTLDDFLNSIGRRHSRVLNIEAEHFTLMEDAIIDTFSNRFGDKFTVQLQDLWIKLYEYLANKLLENYTEEFVLTPEGDAVSAVICPITGNVVSAADYAANSASGAGSANTSLSTAQDLSYTVSDSESLFSSDSLSVKQKKSIHSMETTFSKASSPMKLSSGSSTNISSTATSFATTIPSIPSQSADLISSFGSVKAKKIKLNRLYNFGFRKSERV